MKLGFVAALVVLVVVPATGWAHDVSNVKIGTVIGPHAEGYTDGIYGADLGIPVARYGELRFLFGDAWSDDSMAGTTYGDVQGAIGYFPGSIVEGVVEDDTDTPTWRRDMPILMYRDANENVRPMQVLDENDSAMEMGLGKTPITAFANADPSSSGAMFAIFNHAEPIPCNSDSDCNSGDGRCEPLVGTCGGLTNNTNPCGPIGSACLALTGMTCQQPQGNSGVCVMPRSSLWNGGTRRTTNG